MNFNNFLDMGLLNYCVLRYFYSCRIHICGHRLEYFVLFFNIRKLHKVTVTSVTSLVLSSEPCKMFVLLGVFSNSHCINCTRGSKLSHNTNWKSLTTTQRAKSRSLASG